MRAAAVVRSRVRMARHALAFNGATSYGRRARGGLLVALVLATCVFGGAGAAFRWAAHDGGGVPSAAAVLTLVLTATLVALLVFDLHEVLTTLLQDGDLDVLRRAPIRPAPLFAIKLLDALPRTALLLGVLAVPAIAAYARTLGIAPWEWVLLPFQLAGLWAVPLGLGIAGAVMVLAIAPARYARDGLGLVSTLLVFALWLANSFLLPRLDVAGVRELLDGVDEAYGLSPGRWLARAIAASGESGGALEALRWTGAIVLAGAAAIALALSAVVMGLERAQSRLAARPARHARRRAAAVRAGRPGRPRPLALAMLARDARLLRRDWTALSDVLTAAALWGLLPLVGVPLFATAAPQLARAILVVLAVGLGYEIGARALPFERGAMAWARLAPLAATRWVRARYAGAVALAAALLALATLGAAWALRLTGRQVLGVAWLAGPALVLALAIGMWTGARHGDPAWRNPRAMLTLPGRLLGLLLLILQGGAWLGGAALAELDPRAAMLLGIVAPVAVALAVGPILAGAARTLERRDDWIGAGAA